MSLGKLVSMLALVALVFPVTGCSSGGSDDATNTISSVVQDIGLDPDGTTTVITFSSANGLSGSGLTNFESNGGQTVTDVSVTGKTVTVQWDARVTSADQVRATGLDNVGTAFHAVVPSSSAAPTFSIANGTQTAPLGGDSFDVVFSGPRVLESDVEDLANWTLTIDSTDLDLTDSTIVFSVGTQTATVTLGELANLHSTFTLTPGTIHAVTDVLVDDSDVGGTASGDAAAPTLVGATQNLPEEEFGRIVDFQFSEPMDPVFSVQLSHFGVTSPDIAVTVERPSDDVLRVTFNNPIVPGVNTVSLTGIVDAHGNAFTDAIVPIDAGAPVVNAYTTLTANTVANTGGDTITVETSQAFDPDTAENPAAWTLDVDAVAIDLSTQTLTYDLASKTLTIALDFDMQNGDAFTVTGVSVLDVDGDTFTLASGGTVSGDAVAPTLTNVLQNRNVDVTGKTLIVQFSEDVDEATAETTTNWSVSGAQNVTAAELLAGGDSVRLEFDALVVPGDVTFSAANVTDVAGNVMAPVVGAAIGSTDTTVPTPVFVVGRAIEGAFDDTVTVEFDDDMIESEVEDPANWTVESPVATVFTTAGDPISYNSATKTAVLTLLVDGNLQRGSNVRVTFANCRDISGNVVSSTPVNGSIVSETTLPVVTEVYRDAVNLDQLVVVFSEPVLNADDAYDLVTNPDGARYVLRTSLGVLRGAPTAYTPSSDLLSVRLAFGFVVDAADTLDVSGVVDMCGNPLFPDLAVATVAQATTQPSLNPGSCFIAAISGENNDFVAIVFDRKMNPYKLLDPANYTMTGPVPVNFSTARFLFDGNSTVTIGFNNFIGHNIDPGAVYTLTVNNVWSAQGVKRTSTDTAAGLVAFGDAAAPTVLVTDVRIDPSTVNGLIVTSDEALDVINAENPALYDLDGGNLALTATRSGPRNVSLTFAITPTVGQNLQFTLTDLANNTSGSLSRAVQAADTTPPLVGSVTGLAVPNLGRDTVSITFDEQVNLLSALWPANYSITSGALTVSLGTSRPSYESSTNTVTWTLPIGSELDSTAGVSVTVANVYDISGNIMPSPVTLSVAVIGDVTPPAFTNAFVALHDDPTGATVDVLFSEDVDATFAGTALNWTTSTGPTVSSVTMMEGNRARLVLTGALGASATVGITGVPDLAKNTAGSLAFDPFE